MAHMWLLKGDDDGRLGGAAGVGVWWGYRAAAVALSGVVAFSGK